MRLVAPLLTGLELSPGQLAELRAIEAMYYTRLATDASEPGSSGSMLEELVLSRVRDMLHDEQRVTFDRNRARQLDESRQGAHTEPPR